VSFATSCICLELRPLWVDLTRSLHRRVMTAICAFETFGVGETLGGQACRAGPTGAVVTKNSPRRAFWEKLGDQIAGALIF
jgi:hypothetical protein